MEEQIVLHLKNNYEDDIIDIMNNRESHYCHFPLHVRYINRKSHAFYSILKEFLSSLLQLKSSYPDIYIAVKIEPWIQVQIWNECILRVQKLLSENNLFLDVTFSIKPNCHTRFISMPESDNNSMQTFPTIDQLGQFVQIKGE